MASEWDDDDYEGDEWKLIGGEDAESRALEVYKEDQARGPCFRTLGCGDRVLVRKQYLPDSSLDLCHEWETQECRVIETTPDQVYLGIGRNAQGRKFWLDRRLLVSVIGKHVPPEVDKTSAPKKLKKKKR